MGILTHADLYLIVRSGTLSQKGRFLREPLYGRRIALDPREKVSQNLFSFLISQKAVVPMSWEWR